MTNNLTILSSDLGIVKKYLFKKKFFSFFNKAKEEALLTACLNLSNLKTQILAKYPKPGQNLIEKNFSKILRQALFHLSLEEKKPQSFMGDTLKKLENEFHSIIAAIEPFGIQVYPSKKTEENKDIRNVVKYLFYDIPVSRELINLQNIKAIFFKKNPLFLSQVRSEFQSIFNHIFQEIKNKKHDELIIEMLIGNILSLYCYMQPSDLELITIPQKIESKWMEIPFKVEKIKLTPLILGSPVYAFGLKPLSKEGHPIFLCKGTTYPQDSGFLSSIMTDFTPFFSVGGLIYLFYRKKISRWIEDAFKERQTKLRIYGQSLGGASAYHIALDNPDKVKVFGYVPPGLLTYTVHKYKDIPIMGKIFCHENDFVHLLGKHPKGIEFYKIITSAPRKGFAAHSRAFGSEEVLVLKVDENKENKRFIRLFLEIVHQMISFVVFMPTLIIKSFSVLVFCPAFVLRKIIKIKSSSPNSTDSN